MDIKLVMFKDDDQRAFPLEGDRTILGRRQDCDLRIPTKDVSRQHCSLMVKNGSLIIKDLGSSNGTYLNDKRVTEAEVSAGDRLRVGPVTFVVQIDGRPAKIKPSKDSKTPPETPVTESGEDEETFDLTEADLLGDDDEFELDDPISELDEAHDDEDDMP